MLTKYIPERSKIRIEEDYSETDEQYNLLSFIDNNRYVYMIIIIFK